MEGFPGWERDRFIRLCFEKHLCRSRKSFFGGSVSTREEAAAPDYKIRAQTASKAPQRVQTRPEKPRGTAQQARKPAAKRPRGTADDFGDLDDYNDQPSKPYTAVNASKVPFHLHLCYHSTPISLILNFSSLLWDALPFYA